MLPLDGVPEPALAPESKRRASWPQRARAMVAEGVHPITRRPVHPELGTCGDCRFRQFWSGGAKSYPKCAYGGDPDNPSTWRRATNGETTDVRAYYPACADHQPIEED
jgi:hypothetical protein